MAEGQNGDTEWSPGSPHEAASMNLFTTVPPSHSGKLHGPVIPSYILRAVVAAWGPVVLPDHAPTEVTAPAGLHRRLVVLTAS